MKNSYFFKLLVFSCILSLSGIPWGCTEINRIVADHPCDELKKKAEDAQNAYNAALKNVQKADSLVQVEKNKYQAAIDSLLKATSISYYLPPTVSKIENIGTWAANALSGIDAIKNAQDALASQKELADKLEEAAYNAQKAYEACMGIAQPKCETERRAAIIAGRSYLKALQAYADQKAKLDNYKTLKRGLEAVALILSGAALGSAILGCPPCGIAVGALALSVGASIFILADKIEDAQTALTPLEKARDKAQETKDAADKALNDCLAKP
ncbi:hypothetical protein [Spirosoma gilvum]